MKKMTKKEIHAQQVAEKLAQKEAEKQRMYFEMKNHPVGKAVEPLLQDAIASAEEDSKKYVEKLLKLLEDGGWDLQVVAPYPKGSISREQYEQQLSLRTSLTTITKPADGASPYRRYNDPMPRQPCAEGVARFIQNDKDSAAFNYEQFQYKLVKKVGECVSATLDGNHIWGFSILTITKADGTIQKWKTQQIVNRSKYGKYFNQYPSRIVK